jgi:hypothetical protein
MKKRNINIAVVIIAIVVLVVLFLSIDAILKIKSTQTTEGAVCGKINVQCITTPCDPVEETFSSRYEAEQRDAFDIRDGECITDFETCIAAGNPAMESYPRQCRDPESGKTFTENAWRLDDIQLRRHESDFSYGCFGCSTPKDDSPALCIDPIIEMRFVPETKNLHCNENFEVVINESATEELGNIGEACSQDSDCITPMRYMIQSNCPYGSACINDECRIVCPIIDHSLEETSECNQDTDCDCSERQDRTISCICDNGSCVSVEE